ncbi:MAG: hypothetical protein WKF30_18585, partial [Pyrinomonadaceae bacterium]
PVRRSSATSAPIFSVAYKGGASAWVAGQGGAILRRTDSVATLQLPRPRLRPALRGRAPQTTPSDPRSDDDIPLAVPLERIDRAP